MGSKKRYGGKDIIIKVIEAEGFSSKDGRVDGVSNALGEDLHVEEYDFV